MIKHFVKVTTILDQKQQRNVALYKDLQAEMSEGGLPEAVCNYYAQNNGARRKDTSVNESVQRQEVQLLQ